MTKNDGGAAFPTNPIYNGDDRATEYDGMSLRDWFAGRAAAAILGGLVSAQISTNDAAASEIAVSSYKMADAMIAERDK